MSTPRQTPRAALPAAPTRRRLWGPVAALVAIHAAAFGAPWFSPYDPAFQDRDRPYAPPTLPRLVDAEGRFHPRPFVYPQLPVPDEPGRYAEDRSRPVPLRFFVPAGELPGGGGFRLAAAEPPAALHLLGTDGFGRDVFSRLLYGARLSLSTGLLAALLAVGLGSGLGAVAGSRGGWVDEGLMRTAELGLTLPWIYLVLGLRALLPLDASPAASVASMVAVIGLMGAPAPARLVRGVVRSARQRDFVLAARGFGASDLHVLRKHLLPQASSVALTQAALLLPRFVLAEVTLAFLGLGAGEPSPSWGTLLASLRQAYVVSSCWWMFLPALALMGVILSYHRLSDSLHGRLGGGAL